MQSENMVGTATKYEVISKANPEHIYEATLLGGGSEPETVEFSSPFISGPVVFINKGGQGDLENPDWSVREVGTHSQPDGTGTVEVVNSQVVEIQDGVSTPQLPTEVAPEVAPEVESNDVPMMQPSDLTPAAEMVTDVAPNPESNI